MKVSTWEMGTLKKSNKAVGQNRYKEEVNMNEEKINNDVTSEKKNSLREKMYFIILLLVIIMIISAIAMLIISFIKNKSLQLENFSFALLMSGLAIFVTGTIFIPKFLLERATKDALRDFAKDIVENYAKEKFTNNFNSRIEEIHSEIEKTQSNIDKCDAHLSRMIALGLSKDTPIWSIGWAFRSLKRYRRLDNENNVGLKEYTDFIALISNKVIKGAVLHFKNAVQEEMKKQTKPTVDCAWIVLSNEQGNMESMELNEDDKRESVRTAIRAIKDIIDLEYAIYIDKDSDAKKTAKEEMKTICSSVGYFCIIISAALIKYLPTGMNTQIDNANDCDGVNILTDRICEISDYGDKGKSANTQETKDSFRHKVVTQLSVIRVSSNSGLLSLDDEKLWKSHTFFE